MRFGSRPGESVSLTGCTIRRDAIRKPQGQGIRRACRLGGGGVERAGPGAGAESGAPIRRGPGANSAVSSSRRSPSSDGSNVSPSCRARRTEPRGALVSLSRSPVHRKRRRKHNAWRCEGPEAARSGGSPAGASAGASHTGGSRCDWIPPSTRRPVTDRAGGGPAPHSHTHRLTCDSTRAKGRSACRSPTIPSTAPWGSRQPRQSPRHAPLARSGGTLPYRLLPSCSSGSDKRPDIVLHAGVAECEALVLPGNQRAETITTRSNLITHPGARDVIRRTTVRALTAVAVTAVLAQPPPEGPRGRPADRRHGRGGRRQPLPPDGTARPASRLPADVDVPRAPLCGALVSGPDGQRRAARVRGRQALRVRAGHG